jgi:hypothetical protein
MTCSVKWSISYKNCIYYTFKLETQNKNYIIKIKSIYKDDNFEMTNYYIHRLVYITS